MQDAMRGMDPEDISSRIIDGERDLSQITLTDDCDFSEYVPEINDALSNPDRGETLSSLSRNPIRFDGSDLMGMIVDPEKKEFSYALWFPLVSFNNTKISDSFLSEMELSSSDFSHADLQRSHLSRCYLGYSEFKGSSLRDSVFDNCDLSYVIFDGTDLRGASFPRSRSLGLASYTDVKVGPKEKEYLEEMIEESRHLLFVVNDKAPEIAVPDKAKKGMIDRLRQRRKMRTKEGLHAISGERFCKEIISGRRDFRGMYMPDDSDISSHVEELNDYIASLDPEDLRREPIDISGSHIRGIIASGLHIPYLRAADAYLEASSFQGSDFRNSEMSHSDFCGSDFNGSYLEGSRLSFSNLSNCNLSSSSSERADLSFSQLFGSDLSGMSADRAKFIYSDMRSVNGMENVSGLGSAIYDKTTVDSDEKELIDSRLYSHNRFSLHG